MPGAQCGTVNTLKLDVATGGLTDKSYKSRHCFDANRWTREMDKRELPHFEPTSSTVADDLLVKITLSDAAARDRHLTKLDESNAYAKGERRRPATYMHTPATLPMFDADGTRLVIEFNGTPIWGEGPAGAEWQATFHAGLVADGWEPAEGVPCMYTRRFVDGHDAVMLTIVDDILVVTKSAGDAMLKAFDAPSREACVATRSVSHTPLAALVLMNDPVFVAAARGLAARVLGDDPAASTVTANALSHAISANSEISVTTSRSKISVYALLRCVASSVSRMRNAHARGRVGDTCARRGRGAYVDEAR